MVMETASSALSPPEAVLCALCASVVNAVTGTPLLCTRYSRTNDLTTRAGQS